MRCLFILPTGKVNPALDDIVLVPLLALPDLAPLPALDGALWEGEGDLATLGFLDLLFGTTEGPVPELGRILPPVNPVNGNAAEDNGTLGALETEGRDVSNNPVGTLEVVFTIEVALKASFPPLSSPSSTVKDGNIENTLFLYPASL